MKIKNILFALVCFLFLGTVNAASVEFTNYPTTVKKGEEFEIRLVIKNASDLKYVKATNYRIDSDLIETINYDTLSSFVGLGNGNSPYTSFDNEPGFALSNADGKSGNVEVLYIKYKVKDTVEAGELIHIRMDEVYVSSNDDGSNAENISNADGYCITIRITDDETVVDNPKCKIKDGKYYDNNGKVVTKDVYEDKCGNPATGVNSTAVIVIAGTLLTIGCYVFFKKNKMYY